MDSRMLQTYLTGTKEELKTLIATMESYEMVRFKDHVSEFPDVRIETDLGNGRIRHELDEGQIFQEGTDLDAENLGTMDLGIYALWVKYKELFDFVQALTLQVVALKGAAINNMPSNIFFAGTDDLTVVEGWHDVENKRVVAM